MSIEREENENPKHIPTRVGNSLIFGIGRIIKSDHEESIYEILSDNMDEISATEAQLTNMGFQIKEINELDRISIGDTIIGPVSIDPSIVGLAPILSTYKFYRGPVGITEDKDVFPKVVAESSFSLLPYDHQTPDEER